MKNKDHQISCLKYELRDKKQKGVKTIKRKLNREQAAFVRSHYRTEPWLYSIRTRLFSKELRKRYSILKDLHFAYIKGKPIITRKLKIADIKVLKRNNVKYWCGKDHIYLQEEIK